MAKGFDRMSGKAQVIKHKRRGKIRINGENSFIYTAFRLLALLPFLPSILLWMAMIATILALATMTGAIAAMTDAGAETIECSQSCVWRNSLPTLPRRYPSTGLVSSRAVGGAYEQERQPQLSATRASGRSEMPRPTVPD